MITFQYLSLRISRPRPAEVVYQDVFCAQLFGKVSKLFAFSFCLLQAVFASFFPLLSLFIVISLSALQAPCVVTYDSNEYRLHPEFQIMSSKRSEVAKLKMSQSLQGLIPFASVN